MADLQAENERLKEGRDAATQRADSDRAKRLKIADGIADLIIEGQAIDRECQIVKQAAPSKEARKWAARVEGYLAAHLDTEHVERFSKGAATLDGLLAHAALSGAIRTRVARLEQFSKELARE